MSDENPTIVKPQEGYQDDDLVYVDPHARTVVGRVEFAANGKPKPMPLPSCKEEDAIASQDPSSNPEEKQEIVSGKGKGRTRVRRIRYCPWGTYRSMKRVFKLEGKPPRIESQKTLDEVIEKALQEPFWD